MDFNNYLPIITEWQNLIANVAGITRPYNQQLYNAANSKPIKIITGFRRSGKSFLVKMVARSLVENKSFLLKNILYINFEDYRLNDILHIKELDQLIQYFLKHLAGTGRKLIILDEIQLVPDWDKLIRTLYEKETDLEIFLTGSNSELLSSELGSNLAGRFINIEILPFNFKEFLKYQNIDINDEINFYKHHADIKYLFSKYQKFGGLPETFTISDETAKFSYLQGVFSKVILDDIIKRFNVRQPDLIEKIIYYMYMAIGTTVNPTRIFNFIKNEGFQTKSLTIATYMDYIVKTFAMYEVERFDWKLKRVFNVNKKYYSVDTGLINLFQRINNNFSKQLENLVFLKLKTMFPTIYYGALDNGREIDFIVKDIEGKFHKYQVTTTLNSSNETRELSVYDIGDKYLNGSNIILTMDEKEEQIKMNDVVIEKKYLLKWLLV